jgi:hypothetical protein
MGGKGKKSSKIKAIRAFKNFVGEEKISSIEASA